MKAAGHTEVFDHPEFMGTRRFKVLRRLGAGGMGVVYEALDRERNLRVALKTLRAMSADSLFRFKSEFREFQDLQHPNLVSFGELFADGSDWFFTMELIEGGDFIDYVRPAEAAPAVADSRPRDDVSPSAATQPGIVPRSLTRPPRPAFDESRLRSALAQLAQGLVTLHDAQKVHRDVKPSNILVTAAGRLVLLDFGLATDLQRAEDNLEVDVVGTVDYMAPEQAASRAVGPEADWYSVGVLLYEALTGLLPFNGTDLEVLINKQRLEPTPPSELVPTVSPELNQLCMELLHFNPSLRPSGRALLARLGVPDPRAHAQRPSIQSFTQSSAFVGRAAELASLFEAYERVRRGHTVAIHVHGESGLGKSALVRHFTEGLAARGEGTVVLTGRCYERESVPYKAVDGLIDALSRYLARLPKAQAAALLPPKAPLLAQVFPVLSRVEAVAESPRPTDEVLDPQELRSRLFAALRALFTSLAERRPLVLVIDDLQWADTDSLAMLAEVLRPPDSPKLLLITTVRNSAGEGAIDESTPGEVHHIQLARMSTEEGRELATLLLRRAPELATLAPDAIAREAGGHPLFIDELIRHAAAAPVPRAGPIQLEDALWSRIVQLGETARRVLEIVVLAGGRLLQQTVAKAAEMSFGDLAKQVAVLRVAHLARTTGMRGTDFIEPYHDRVRETVVWHLSGEARQRTHRRIALALEISGNADPEALTMHWHEAGDLQHAAHYAARAAEKATRALAFDRAAQLYQLCLELVSTKGPEAQKLRVSLALARANAGRGREAAEAFLAAAAEAPTAEALDLRRRAAEQLLISGHIDEGLAALRAVLGAVELELSSTPRRAVASLLFRRLQVRLRGLRFSEHDASQIPANDLTKVDVCWSAAIALGLVDTVQGADFQARNLLHSLRLGEPYRVARALAMECGYAAIVGGPGAERSAKLARLAEELAQRVGHPHAVGLSMLMSGIAAFCCGRWRFAREQTEQAELFFREGCTGVTWELDNAQLYPLWSRLFLGELQVLADRSLLLLKEARERGDLYLETNLRTRVRNTSLLLVDQPEAAANEVTEGIARWSSEGFHLQHLFALLSLADIDLYSDAPERAYARVAESWPHLERSNLLHVQVLRLEAYCQRARCALAAATADTRGEAERYRVQAERDAHRIERERMAWSAPLAGLIRAAVAAARDQREHALSHLESASAAFTAAGMSLHAAAARWRHGALVGATAGRDLMAEAEARMRAQGIRAPLGFVHILAPGFRD